MAWQRSKTYGGSGGGAFSDDLTEVVKLAGFNIRSATFVEAIQPVFRNCAGTLIVGQWHGGSGGSEQKVLFDQDEKLVSVRGRAGAFVDQLVFTTNKDTYGVYGGNGGEEFDSGELTEVGGFFGRSGVYLDAVGFFCPC